MKVSITDKKDNPLLNRTEVSGSIIFEGATPSNNDLANVIAKELKKEISLVVVKNIYNRFSHQEATFEAVVYDSAEAKSKVEMATKHLKKKAEEDRKKAAAKAEEKKEEPKQEEKPAEEKKEEAKSAEEKEPKQDEEVPVINEENKAEDEQNGQSKGE